MFGRYFNCYNIFMSDEKALDLTQHIFKPSEIAVGGKTISYSTTDADDAHIIVDSEPEDSQQEFERSVTNKLTSEYWFLNADFQKEKIHEKFRIVLDNGVEVDLYNFQTSAITEEQLANIGITLSKYYHRLRDKKLWSLQTIQVRSKDELNKKSGQPFRGKEFPQQHRFELFPASFEKGKYRGVMQCNWEEGSVAHETTHVVLESMLSILWSENRDALGWELLDDQLLILPGEATTAQYNRDYENCPTDYAGFQPDDDRADSAASMLLDPSRLNSVRRVIMNEVFLPPEANVHPPEIIKETAELPELSKITVKKRTAPSFSFRMGKVTYNPNPKAPISIFEYRRLRKTQQ